VSLKEEEIRTPRRRFWQLWFVEMQSTPGKASELTQCPSRVAEAGTTFRKLGSC
jgi:hypothetical protein